MRRLGCSVVLLGVLGALIFWLSGVTGNTAADDAAELERLRAGAGVRVTGTMTDVREREQRSGGRRGVRVITVFCPVYSFSDGGGRSTIVGGECETDKADLPERGSTVPVIYDADGYERFIDTAQVAAGLEAERTTYPWWRWGGLALAVLCGAVVLWAVVGGLVRRVRGAGREETFGK